MFLTEPAHLNNCSFIYHYSNSTDALMPSVLVWAWEQKQMCQCACDRRLNHSAPFEWLSYKCVSSLFHCFIVGFVVLLWSSFAVTIAWNYWFPMNLPVLILHLDHAVLHPKDLLIHPEQALILAGRQLLDASHRPECPFRHWWESTTVPCLPQSRICP